MFVSRVSDILYRYLPAIISAAILSLSFSSFNLSYFAWIGLVPLFFALQEKDAKSAFLLSCACGFLFFFLSMYWLVSVTVTGWIILSLYQGLYFGVFGLFSSCVMRLPRCSEGVLRGRASCTQTQHATRLRSVQVTRHATPLGPGNAQYVIIPAAWCLLEYLRSHIGGGIGWNLLAYSQYENLPVIQIADILGAYGVSFLMVLVNFTVFTVVKMGIRCRKENSSFFAKSRIPFKKEINGHPLFQVLVVFPVLIFVLVYGYRRIDALTENSIPVKTIKVSVVQANIKQSHKWDSAYRNYILAQYKRLTIDAAGDKPDIIIWPETSVPGYPDRDRRLMEYVQGLAKKVKIPILVGTPLIATESSGYSSDYNSALLFSKQGKIVKQYNKLHLVLFGEFIPLSRYFSWVYDILPLTGKFIPGSEYTVFQLPLRGQPYSLRDKEYQEKGVPPLYFSVLICFEDIFPDLVRQFVKRGAFFMVNITNDAWFGKTCAAYQHASNSVFRAVENRRPFVRSANTGLSCFIDRTGMIYARVEFRGEDIFVPGHKTSLVTIYPDTLLTFYTRFGDIFVMFCFLVVAFFLIDYICLRKYNN